MARGTQHRKRRPKPAPGVAQPAPKPQKRVQHASWENQLFFSRLRLHAKWVFAVLVVVLAGSFVFLGVGSGSTDFGNAISNFFSKSSGGGSSLSSLQKKVHQNPKDAAGWLALSTKLGSDQKPDAAAQALARYTKLRPKDEGELQTLAGLYFQRFVTHYNDAQTAQSQIAALAPYVSIAPPTTSKLGKALSDPTALEGQMTYAVLQNAEKAGTTANEAMITAGSKSEATYERLVALAPETAQYQLDLGDSARYINDTKTEIAAYNKFLKLAPTDPLVATVKGYIKQAKAAAPTATSSVTTG